MAAEPLASIRIDKWLWAARFFKTRSLAQEAVELGRVRLAGQRLKPSRDVKPGDRLTVERGEERFEIFVEKISAVRGPPLWRRRFIGKRMSLGKSGSVPPKCAKLRWNPPQRLRRAVPPSATPV